MFYMTAIETLILSEIQIDVKMESTKYGSSLSATVVNPRLDAETRKICNEITYTLFGQMTGLDIDTCFDNACYTMCQFKPVINHDLLLEAQIKDILVQFKSVVTDYVIGEIKSLKNQDDDYVARYKEQIKFTFE